MRGELNQNLETFYREFSDSELLRERVELIRSLGHIAETLAIVNGIRAERAPGDLEAEVREIRG